MNKKFKVNKDQFHKVLLAIHTPVTADFITLEGELVEEPTKHGWCGINCGLKPECRVEEPATAENCLEYGNKGPHCLL